MRQEKVPQGIGHGPALAAADVVGRGNWPFYRFERLSNRALAASGGMCRCGSKGRENIKIYRKCKVLFPYSTGEKSFCAERGSGSGSYRRVPEPVIARHPRGARERERYENGKRFVVRRSAYILAFAGYAAIFFDMVRRAGSLETCGFKQRFWSLLGLRPKVTRARGRGTFPAGGTGDKRTGRRGRRPLRSKASPRSIRQRQRG